MSDSTTKRCTKCGEIKSLTEFSLYKGSPRRWCRACVKIYNRAYREQYPEKVRSATISWRNRNLEKVKATKQRHYAENKEYYRKKHDRWYAVNRDRSIQRSRAYFRTEEGKIRNRLNANKHRAVARRGDVTIEELTALMQRQTRCAYCKKKFTNKLPATVDHVVPLSKGGLHTISNLVLACKPCNSRKHANMIYLL